MAVFPDISTALGGDTLPWTVVGYGDLPSYYAVTDMAVEAMGAAAAQLALYAGVKTPLQIDRQLASFWYKTSTSPIGWTPAPLRDAVTGDYRTKDGWIRLHANAPHHRRAELAVLGLSEDADRDQVTNAVAQWTASELETAVVEAGGCAAEMRSSEAWAAHPQGRAVAQEPLIQWQEHAALSQTRTDVPIIRPLEGIRVLDLTRVLAGPAATRFLAAFGADVLRIDPPWWDEPPVALEMTVGKRCAGLDLRMEEDRARLLDLAARADLVVHGYRPHALSGLGVGPDDMRARNPGLIDVSLCAFGWTGPWASRRGFDSLVQMSAGIAQHGMTQSASDRPTPLPAQALDHTTGYLAAAACLRALRLRRDDGRVLSARLSLARTAELLKTSQGNALVGGLGPPVPDDFTPEIEQTDWGPVHRLTFPIQFDGPIPQWRYPASNFRTTPAGWDRAFP